MAKNEVFLWFSSANPMPKCIFLSSKKNYKDAENILEKDGTDQNILQLTVLELFEENHRKTHFFTSFHGFFLCFKGLFIAKMTFL